MNCGYKAETGMRCGVKSQEEIRVKGRYKIALINHELTHGWLKFVSYR